MRRYAIFAAGAVAGALTLGACSSTHSTTRAPAVGRPAATISVALSQVACTARNVCLSAGASATGLAPTTSAEFSTPTHAWRPLATPNAPQPALTGAACTLNACVLVGASTAGDLVWSFDAQYPSLRAVTAPSGGLAVRAISCDANSGNCALVDDGPHAVPRLSLSFDGGASWGSPEALTWATGDEVTSLACPSANLCLVAATSSSGAVVERSSDGGQSWQALTTPAGWRSLTLSWCRARACVALVDTATGQRLARTTTAGRTWRSTALAGPLRALACVSASHCVGVTATSSAGLVRVVGARESTVPLKYVPTALMNVACGNTRCVAIGATTLVNLRAQP